MIQQQQHHFLNHQPLELVILEQALGNKCCYCYGLCLCYCSKHFLGAEIINIEHASERVL